jgi:hypothetical protein
MFQIVMVNRRGSGASEGSHHSTSSALEVLSHHRSAHRGTNSVTEATWALSEMSLA